MMDVWDSLAQSQYLSYISCWVGVGGWQQGLCDLFVCLAQKHNLATIQDAEKMDIWSDATGLLDFYIPFGHRLVISSGSWVTEKGGKPEQNNGARNSFACY